MIVEREAPLVRWLLPSPDEPTLGSVADRVSSHAFVDDQPWLPLCRPTKQLQNKLGREKYGPKCPRCRKQVEVLRKARIWDPERAKIAAGMLADQLERNHMDMVAWAIRNHLDTSSYKAMRQQLLDCHLSNARVEAVMQQCSRRRQEPLVEVDAGSRP